ncbi:MAG TPA: EcsC family protein [Steroidobacteraceae bacterium]|nr:EcsC family protein [Steroidobacteraceae bacterium]
MTERDKSDYTEYERRVLRELDVWRGEMLERPSLINWAAQRVQAKVNSYIPEKVHETLTTVIKQMTRAVLTGSNYSAPPILVDASLEERDARATERIEFYMKAGAVEGGITGAGGIFLGLADFPLLLGIKLKLQFELAALYGHSGDDFRERLYILYLFQLAFSSHEQRRKCYLDIEDWDERGKHLPQTVETFDWRTFQQEYRNYIDLAKLVQLVPIIGAPVGALVNHRLLGKLGATARNGYRQRWLKLEAKSQSLVVRG